MLAAQGAPKNVKEGGGISVGIGRPFRVPLHGQHGGNADAGGHRLHHAIGRHGLDGEAVTAALPTLFSTGRLASRQAAVPPATATAFS